MLVLTHKNFRIAADPHQWIIQRRRLEGGRQRWDSNCFHKSLSGAVFGLARLKVCDFERVTPEDLETLCDHLDNFEKN